MSTSDTKPLTKGSSAATKPTAVSHSSLLLLTLGLTVVFVALGFAAGMRTKPHLAWAYGGAAAFLLCWQAWLWALARQGKIELTWELAAARSHYVQALVQLSVYAYWGWYWRKVWGEAPQILSQVAYLYVFDALLTWSRRQTWRLGFGPWPIILSTNLFLWFKDDWYVYQFVMVSLGGLGKQFIRWERGGKLTHIFNPSAFGLTVVALVLLFTSSTDCTWGSDIATTQDRVPHLLTLIFLGGLVVQSLFGVTLLTSSAAATLALLLLGYTHATGVYLFVNTNISAAIFLGMHLLMTDPATTPRSSLGKVMFGSLYGLGVFQAVIVLNAFAAPIFYDKLLVVPLLNLMVPALDRWSALGAVGKYARWEVITGVRKLNAGYMGGWTVLFVVMVATRFIEAPHPGSKMEFWMEAAREKRPHATEYLQQYLEIFDQWAANPDERVAVSGPVAPQDRERAFASFYDEVAAIYAEGKLIPPDPAKATLYFTKACENGNVNAAISYVSNYFVKGGQEPIDGLLAALEQSGAGPSSGKIDYILGYACHSGRGRPLDLAKARQYFQKSAALGESSAWQPLALMQLSGEGGPADHAGAAQWLEKMAEANNGPGCLYLAQMYGKGDGVPQDEQKAEALLKKACDLGVTQACEQLKKMGR